MHRPYLIATLVALACFRASSLADQRYAVLDEPVYLYIDNDKHGNLRCQIDVRLWVSGPKRDSCIRKLEQAAHLARFEVWMQTQRRTP